MLRTWLIIFFVLAFMACEDKTNDEPAEQKGKININFEHLINGEIIVFDTLIYTNEAGNRYLVNEIQYFISDVKLFKNDGTIRQIGDWKEIHYVDTDLEDTWLWEIYDKIDPGTYDSISFTFGITEEKNVSFMYVNAPEKDMFWPEYLGGGYHYMKLNGKWLPDGQTVQTNPFDFHLGIGQIYYSYPDSITGFIHNNFNVTLPESGFSVASNEIKSFTIAMHIEKWFSDPHIYDHDIYGGYIMQNQEAMQKVKENGKNVFSFKVNQE